MALESWMIKVKTAISKKTKKKSKDAGILAFEIAGIMSKLLHLHHSLSDRNSIRLRTDLISLEGIRKIVSNDDSFLLALACAETVETLRSVARSTSLICRRCVDPNLRRFDFLFQEFADSDRDPYGWALTSCKEIESKNRKMDRYVSVTTALYREMEELSAAESALRKSGAGAASPPSLPAVKDLQRVADVQQKISAQKQQIRYLKQKSLWGKSFDSIASLLAHSIFTVLARIKLVFGVGSAIPAPASLNRSLSASAVVYPSGSPNPGYEFTSGPLNLRSTSKQFENRIHHSSTGFLDSKTQLLKPPPSTLGAAGLALHYANLIMVMERMIKSPQLVGPDARDDLYAMLPGSIRSALRGRLRGVVGFGGAGDPELAGEWRDALGRILGWIFPMAHNMIKWQSERSFEQKGLGEKTNVLLLQTLFFANKEKTESAITELLVGLNYIWRFEREMTAKALFDCSKFSGGVLHLQSSC